MKTIVFTCRLFKRRTVHNSGAHLDWFSTEIYYETNKDRSVHYRSILLRVERSICARSEVLRRSTQQIVFSRNNNAL